MSSWELGKKIMKMAENRDKEKTLITISSNTARKIEATLQALKDKGEMTPTEANVIGQKMLQALENGAKEAKDKVERDQVPG